MTYLPHHCTAYPCPICGGNAFTYPPMHAQVLWPFPGCICPPSSEMTCRGDHCPRQPTKPLAAT